MVSFFPFLLFLFLIRYKSYTKEASTRSTAKMQYTRWAILLFCKTKPYAECSGKGKAMKYLCDLFFLILWLRQPEKKKNIEALCQKFFFLFSFYFFFHLFHYWLGLYKSKRRFSGRSWVAADRFRQICLVSFALSFIILGVKRKK